MRFALLEEYLLKLLGKLENRITSKRMGKAITVEKN